MNSKASSRRRFLGIVSASCTASLTGLSGLVRGNESGETMQLVDSLPSLQCPTETGITVCWSVNALSLGSVEFGMKPDKLDQTAYGEVKRT